MGEQSRHGERPTRRQAPPPAGPVPAAGGRGTSGWVVGIAVASALLIVLGTFHVAQGLAALFTDQKLLLGGAQTRLEIDTTVWGWLHLLLGIVVIVAGFFTLGGRRWARGVGVAVALLSAGGSMSLLPDHVPWVVAIVALDAIVVVALTVHGSEIRAGD